MYAYLSAVSIAQFRALPERDMLMVYGDRSRAGVINASRGLTHGSAAEQKVPEPMICQITGMRLVAHDLGTHSEKMLPSNSDSRNLPPVTHSVT